MTLDPADTIAAIASPPGPGLRGVIRLSGPRSWEAVLSGFAIALGGRVPDRVVRRSGTVSGRYRLDGLRPALPATLLFWTGPKSYTGQDVAEVHTLGSPPLLELLLSHLLRQGAREAEPGEFTLRAFLSGRIDLTRAEAVLGVIDARNPAQLAAALDQLGGGLASPLKSLRDRLLDVLAHLEANLDFNDEPDVGELGRTELAASLRQGAGDLAQLAERLKGRERPEGHPKVVLVGPPNAGKSRLFNALLGVENAIVSPIAGTTRDYLSARCECDGLTVELIDTAGEDQAQTPIEARAQAFREEQSTLADLLLVCASVDDSLSPVSPPCELGVGGGDQRGIDAPDCSQSVDAPPPAPPPQGGKRKRPILSGHDHPLLDSDRPFLAVSTKCDIEEPGTTIRIKLTTWIKTSAATGEGLDDLRRAIAKSLRAQSPEDDLATTTGARCRESLVRASESLARASKAVSLNAGDELVAVDLRETLDDLGRVVGEVVTDDILDRIFRRFCIGK